MTFQALKWNCDRDGCFNRSHRLKFEVFYDCLPGKISFTDIDGITEVAGNALMLEWKATPGEIKGGQAIMFQRITSGRKFTVLCLAGNAETMTVTHCALYFDGKWREWTPCDTAFIRERIKRWAEWARKNPRIGS